MLLLFFSFQLQLLLFESIRSLPGLLIIIVLQHLRHILLKQAEQVQQPLIFDLVLLLYFDIGF